MITTLVLFLNLTAITKQVLSSSFPTIETSTSRDTSGDTLKETLLKAFQTSLEEIAEKTNPRRLAIAFHSAASLGKFPSVDQSLLDDIRCTDFLAKAICDKGDEFNSNFDILVDVHRLIEKHPECIVAVCSVLVKVLPADCAMKLKGMHVNISMLYIFDTQSVCILLHCCIN